MTSRASAPPQWEPIEDSLAVPSSYAANEYGPVFRSLARTLAPRVAVELGTLAGYSGLHIAAGMRDAQVARARLVLVDLWASYPYRHCQRSDAERRLAECGLSGDEWLTVELLECDALVARNEFPPGSIDLLHVDLSHDAAKLRRALEAWHDRLRTEAVVLIEGGSPERDDVTWMRLYDMSPIAPFLRGRWFRRRFDAVTLSPFPSLTIARKRP